MEFHESSTCLCFKGFGSKPLINGRAPVFCLCVCGLSVQRKEQTESTHPWTR